MVKSAGHLPQSQITESKRPTPANFSSRIVTILLATRTRTETSEEGQPGHQVAEAPLCRQPRRRRRRRHRQQLQRFRVLESPHFLQHRRAPKSQESLDRRACVRDGEPEPDYNLVPMHSDSRIGVEEHCPDKKKPPVYQQLQFNNRFWSKVLLGFVFLISGVSLGKATVRSGHYIFIVLLSFHC